MLLQPVLSLTQFESPKNPCKRHGNWQLSVRHATSHLGWTWESGTRQALDSISTVCPVCQAQKCILVTFALRKKSKLFLALQWKIPMVQTTIQFNQHKAPQNKHCIVTQRSGQRGSQMEGDKQLKRDKRKGRGGRAGGHSAISSLIESSIPAGSLTVKLLFSPSGVKGG